MNRTFSQAYAAGLNPRRMSEASVERFLGSTLCCGFAPLRRRDSGA
jgi:hypothetical protein